MFAALALAPATWSVFHRAIPFELDDSLAYLLRAQQLAECWRQDCPAYISYKSLLFGGNFPPERAVDVANEKNVVFFFHAPLQSAVLLFLRSVGMDWLSALWLFVFAGGLILVASFVCFWRTMFGPAAAGIAAVLFGTSYFVGHGFLWIVPSNVALALGPLGVALVVMHGRRAAGWIVAVAVLAILMHLVGRVSALAIAVAYAAQMNWHRDGRLRPAAIDIVVPAGIALLIAGYTILPLLINAPALHPASAGGWGAKEAARMVLTNASMAIEVMFRSSGAAGGVVGFLLAWAIAAAYMSRRRRRVLIALGALYGALCAASLAHLSPRIPAEVFARLWVPASVVFLGCVAFAGLRIARDIRGRVGGGIMTWIADRSPGYPLRGRETAVVAAQFAVLAVFAVGGVIHIGIGLFLNDIGRVSMATRHDVSFNRKQVDLAVSPECRTIWFDRREAFYAYVLYGAARCGAHVAAYESPATALRPEQSPPDRSVWFNPMGANQGWHGFSAADPIVLSMEPDAPCGRARPGARARILVRAAADDTLVASVADTNIFAASIPAGTSRWVELPFDSTTSQDMRIVSSDGRLEFGGLRFGTDLTLDWPWNQGFRIAFTQRAPQHPTSRRDTVFDTSSYAAQKRCHDVVDDRGFTVLGAPRRD